MYFFSYTILARCLKLEKELEQKEKEITETRKQQEER